MRQTQWFGLFCLCALILPLSTALAENPSQAPVPYYKWAVTNYAINDPLGGLTGDAERGRAIAGSQSRGNCLACHVLPIPEEEFFGNLGPPLTGIGARLPVGMIRLHVVDQSYFNPETVMPGYYRPPQQLNRVAEALQGQTWLTAQEVEDVVAYLASLK